MTQHTSLKSSRKTVPQFRGRLSRNILLLLLPITLIPALLLGGISYSRARTLLLSQISVQMEGFLHQKTEDLDGWLSTRQTLLSNQANNLQFREDVSDYLGSAPNTNAHRQYHDEIIDSLRDINVSISNPYFNQYFFVGSDGIISLATQEEWEGINLSDVSIFDGVFTEDRGQMLIVNPAPLYLPDETDEELYQSLEEFSNEIVILTSGPMISQNQEVLGYLVGITESFVLQEIIEENQNFISDSRMFLLSEDGEVVGLTLNYGLIQINPSQGQIDLYNAGSHADLIGTTYTSHDQENVVGLYDYFPTLNIGIFLEVPQENVLGEINSLAPFFLSILTITGFGLAGLIYLASRQISTPLVALSEGTKEFTSGNWDFRAKVNRNDEVGLLAHSFNQMAEDLSSLYQDMESQVEERTHQVIVAAEISELASGGQEIDIVLKEAAELIINRFELFNASIFLVDQFKEHAVLAEATGETGKSLMEKGFSVPLTDRSLVGWAITNRKTRVISDVIEDNEVSRIDQLGNANAEAAIPITVGREVLGALNVQSLQSDSFSQTLVDTLETIANQLAIVILNFRLSEGTEVDLQQVSRFYGASRAIAKADSLELVFTNANDSLNQSNLISTIYIPSISGDRWIKTSGTEATSYEANVPGLLEISPEQTKLYIPNVDPLIIQNIHQPDIAIHSDLLTMPLQNNCLSAAFIPIWRANKITGLIILGSKEADTFSNAFLQPFTHFAEIIATNLDKLSAIESTRRNLQELEFFTEFNEAIRKETDPQKIYARIHQEVEKIVGQISFFLAIFDDSTDHVEIPYMMEQGNLVLIDPFPLGEGLTSIVIRTREPLMLVEDTAQRAKALGATVNEQAAKSWLGIPLLIGGEVIGAMACQDLDKELRFTNDDLHLLTSLSNQFVSVLQSSITLENAHDRASQLQIVAEIARDTSGTLETEDLLKHAIDLIRDRFGFYHASIFLMDQLNEFAVVRESTGEAGRKMKADEHKLKVGSQSIIGYVTENKEPLVVNDVTLDPTHRFNPLLPDTRAELGIPMISGNEVIGAIDVQSTQPYAFSPDDIEVLQILADQLAVAVSNSTQFAKTQDHLAQHRLIYHVTTAAASSSNLQDALLSSVQGLRVSLGQRVSILLYDKRDHRLWVAAAAGYDQDVYELLINLGEGVTGWAAENRESALVRNVAEDPRYISLEEKVLSELAIPLVYRGELLGVLNIESDQINAFDETSLDILGTLAGSLSAIIVNVRLQERQQQLFQITNKIRRSVSMESIMETTTHELTKALQARKAKISVSGDADKIESSSDNGSPSIDEGLNE